MNRAVEKTSAAVVLALSLAMLVWGGRGLLKGEQAAVNVYEEPLPRMCPPTLGEIAEEFGLGLAARKLGYLAVPGIGMFLPGSSALSLAARKEEARKD
jgi:hypothetical protein